VRERKVIRSSVENLPPDSFVCLFSWRRVSSTRGGNSHWRGKHPRQPSTERHSSTGSTHYKNPSQGGTHLTAQHSLQGCRNDRTTAPSIHTYLEKETQPLLVRHDHKSPGICSLGVNYSYTLVEKKRKRWHLIYSAGPEHIRNPPSRSM
jgi:hypothetical protein